MKQMVQACPVCDAARVEHRGTNAEEGAKYRCDNPGCLARFDTPVERKTKRSVLAERIRSGDLEL